MAVRVIIYVHCVPLGTSGSLTVQEKSCNENFQVMDMHCNTAPLPGKSEQLGGSDRNKNGLKTLQG